MAWNAAAHGLECREKAHAIEAAGGTAVGCIQARQVERARHLLLHTTLPIKAVVAQVGRDR